MNIRPTLAKRRGNILTLAAFMMVGLLGMMALAIDLGVLFVARDELQRTADAAALAATWELIDSDAPAGSTLVSWREQNARERARQFAAANDVLKQSPQLMDSDIEIGFLSNPFDRNESLTTGGIHEPNAVRVKVRRESEVNGRIPTFFARLFQIDGMTADAEATAAVLYNIKGFRAPKGGGNLMILPFALDLQTWNDLMAGVAEDNWTWDPVERQIVPGGDGILEVNLYPQGLASPGNRGTVDIGSSNNSTKDIARQILYGISPQDLEHHGGSLEFDENGELELNADTGISAGIKDELEFIKGQPRIIPIFSAVQGNGNNANYTIVNFVGVRIMEVKLTGKMSSKRVIVQPANVVVRGGIPATEPETSHFVYSPVWLVR